MLVIRKLKVGTSIHTVLEGSGARHRVVLVGSASNACDGFFVKPDECLEVRISALRALCQPTAAVRKHSQSFKYIYPSPYQRQRLTLLLRVLDQMGADSGRRVTMREIAEKIVYPRSILPRAIEWKTCSERRQTQRLVAEARNMTASGYRNLLKGWRSRLVLQN
jgi:hypothetical protein